MQRQYATNVTLPSIIASSLLLFGFLSWVIIETQTSRLSHQRVEEKSHATLSQLAEVIRTPLFSSDIIAVQFTLRNATKDTAIYSASLYDVENTLIAQSSRAQKAPANLEIFKRNILLEDSLAGTLVIAVNSGPIYAAYSNVFFLWALLWLLFSAACTYACYRLTDRISRRLRALTNRLPGSSDPMIDEILELETRLQPLLSNSRELDNHSNGGYYCSVVTGTIKNRKSLNKQLNHENLELLFEHIDLCVDRTIELYGGQRLEGSNGGICFSIRSTQCSKQHILVCLMAMYSLQQLLERLSVKLGIELAINWTLCSDNISSLPTFRYHESISTLKAASLLLSNRIDSSIIAFSIVEYDIDKLSSIARFSKLEEHSFVFQGFPEQRQVLLEKQISHLASICL